MAETEKTVLEKEGDELEIIVPSRVISTDAGTHKIISEGRKDDEFLLKGQELPEPIRHKEKSKEMVQCLPSINLSELTSILRDPNMPSQKIMKEVADKIMLKSEESESDDGSVSSGGGVVGMKGLLDCIFEVSYMHEDSASSDDDDDSFERFPREIPCRFCNKIFGSTMMWNTHVLVAHPQLDPSVLNIRRKSLSESDKKDRSHLAHRKHSRGSSKTDLDAKDIKMGHSPSSDSKHTTELPASEENVPVRKRRSSLPKFQHKEALKGKSDHKHQSGKSLVEKESLPKERKIARIAPSSNIEKLTEDAETKESENKAVESDQAETVTSVNILAKKRCREFLPTDQDTKPEGAEYTLFPEQSSPGTKGAMDKQQNIETSTEDLDTSATPLTGKVSPDREIQPGRKRKTSPPPKSTSTMLASSSSSNPKRSKSSPTQAHVLASQSQQSDSPAEDGAQNDEQTGSTRTNKSATLRSSRGL